MERFKPTDNPIIADKDKDIKNKTLSISLSDDWHFWTDGQHVVLTYDMFNDIAYEIGTELSMMAHGSYLADKHDLLFAYKDSCPKEYGALYEKIQKEIIFELFSKELSEDITFVFPESYIDWAVYNSNPPFVAVGEELRKNNGEIHLNREDIVKDYILDVVLPKAKQYLVNERTIDKVTLVCSQCVINIVVEALKCLKDGVAYCPYDGDIIQTALGFWYQNGSSTTENPIEAFKCFGRAANLGNASAMNQLGWAYQHGLGIDKNPEKAFEWYKKSAEKEDVSGCANLGYCYHTGLGTSVNLHAAIEWYKKSIQVECIGWVCSNLGAIYSSNDSTVKDEFEAFTYYQKAANLGDVSCCKIVGKMLMDGRGVDADKNNAFRHFKKAADTGDIESCRIAGIMLYDGDGIGVNTNGAYPYLKKVADTGDAYCCKVVGKMLMTGNGISVNKESAAQYLHKAAESAFADFEAAIEAGNLLLKGMEFQQTLLQSKRQ